MHLIGQRGIAQPPAPPIARTDMQPHFSGDAARRARQTEQKGDQHPVRERPLTLMEQGVVEIVEGALAAVAPVAFTPGSVVIIAPRVDVMAVAPGALQWALFPLTRCEFSEVQTLLTFALVEAQRGGRVWWPQKNAWHARVARRMTCA